MLAQEEMDILRDETAGELEIRLAPLGARLALQVVEQIKAGTVQGIKQDKSQVTRAPKLTKEHGLIDWTRSAEQVRKQILAMQPWPTAYTFLHRPGKPPHRVLISKVAVCNDKGAFKHPGAGAVQVDTPAKYLIWAGDQPLEILALQPAGKKRMSGAEFLRGHSLEPGERFGPETQ
jgi:methionyl-tRNA formyltransferase